MMASFGAWASTLRALATGQAGTDSRPLTLFVGNEASDADSIVSALAYAYLRSQGPSAGDCDAIPIIACDRADMLLRTETTLLLELCNVSHSDLVFLDDEGIDRLLERTESVVLTDHNCAVGPLAALGDRVIEIVDHHMDLGAHEQVPKLRRQIAFEDTKATAGSCCTLIAEAYLADSCGAELLGRDSSAVARALLGVILIDTVNLEPKAQKATARDLQAVEQLEALASSPTRAELYSRLDAAKFDDAFWATLVPEQCLRYDYKRFEKNGHTFGLSSVLCELQSLAAKEGWTDAAVKRAAEVDLYGVLAYTKSPDGKMGRQLLLVSGDDGTLAAKAADFASGYKNPSLELQHIEIAGPTGTTAFQQLNLGASRKQVAPCLGAFFSSL